MSEEQRPLENLLVDEKDIGEAILHDTLSEYIQIGKRSGDLIPQQPFHQLTAKGKTVIVLLSQRARKELDMVESEWLSPTSISAQSGVKKGTIYPTVRELRSEGIVEDNDGKYRIPTHSINHASEFFQEGEKE